MSINLEQNDFIADDGLVKMDGGKAILPNVIRAVEIARQRGILVVWVVREHNPLGRDVELFRRHQYSPGKVGPAVKGSRGAELVDGLVIREGDYKLVRHASVPSSLHTSTHSFKVQGLITAFDAIALDYQSVTVVVDATAAATPDVHAANIVDMKNFGIATPTLQEWSERVADA
ncbi:hypothetical protein CUMW_131920 [Citrus unshiu]|uniref:Isochorismatase-like domain-containing protein n=1 Tax=Citrus unshiu TaxID=55188 RepID=A0A2H5PFK1_CITUN|nr:hypothetical protein CUMW_131920 [Citrus unshiu]